MCSTIFIQPRKITRTWTEDVTSLCRDCKLIFFQLVLRFWKLIFFSFSLWETTGFQSMTVVFCPLFCILACVMFINAAWKIYEFRISCLNVTLCFGKYLQWVTSLFSHRLVRWLNSQNSACWCIKPVVVCFLSLLGMMGGFRFHITERRLIFLTFIYVYWHAWKWSWIRCNWSMFPI